METFSISTARSYSTMQIIEYERNILNTLSWKIQYPTLAFWCNHITSKWDEYATTFDQEFAYDINWQNRKLPIFRNHTNEEYHLFRSLFQILDLITLDLGILNYKEKILVPSVIYLIVGVFLKYFSYNNIILEFSKDINAYTNYYELNVIFNRFLNCFLEIELDDIIEYVYYVSSFFYLEFDYTRVNISSEDENEIVLFYLL
jgi:hypothetical protein